MEDDLSEAINSFHATGEIMISALGGPGGEGKGEFLLLDEDFKVSGKDSCFSCKIQLVHDTILSPAEGRFSSARSVVPAG